MAKDSVVTPAEAGRLLGIDQFIHVAFADEPRPPFAPHAEPLRDARSLVWSIIGDSSSVRNNEASDLDAVLELRETCPGLVGGVMDDFFHDAPDTPDLARWSVDAVAGFQQRLHAAGLDLWVVVYDQLLGRPLEPWLDHCDVITYWTWKACDLDQLESNFARLEAIAPRQRKLLGCYLWDYGAGQPMPAAAMAHQLNVARRLLAEGRIEGIIFLASNLADLDLQTVRTVRDLMTTQQPPPQTRWSLYRESWLDATPWPWSNQRLEELSAAELAKLPMASDAFLGYSPTDGSVDQVHVTPDLPHPVPRCTTSLALFHDADALTVCVVLERPADPIPELRDTEREDISCVLPGPGGRHGIYLGMDQDGQFIALHQVWDRDMLAPGLTPPQGLAEGCEAGVRVLEGGRRLAWFRISRRYLAGTSFPLSVGRHCYATAELVAWGAPIVWSPPPRGHGQVRLVNTETAPAHPELEALDLHLDCIGNGAQLSTRWRGLDSLDAYRRGAYADYVGSFTIAVNGEEATNPLGSTACPVTLRDGWNRIEILTAFAPPRVFDLDFMPTDRLVVPPVAEVPDLTLDQLRADFAACHEQQERRYRAPGTWAAADKARPCLCHDGVFVAEAYLYAIEHLDDRPVYRERLRETADRMLAAQHDDGWYPCYCSGTRRDGEPQKGDGGAFTQGSVGEFCALASQLLDEPRYWDSAVRAADYAWYPAEINQNYAAFTAWHLGALYAIEPRRHWLEEAIYYIGTFACHNIGPSGAQDGHNFFTGYGDITLRGMASLLAILPRDHRHFEQLRRATIRYTNQLLSRRQSDGSFAARNRKYLGYHHALAGLFHLAEALPELRHPLRPVLLSMYAPTNGPLIAKTARFIAGPVGNGPT